MKEIESRGGREREIDLPTTRAASIHLLGAALTCLVPVLLQGRCHRVELETWRWQAYKPSHPPPPHPTSPPLAPPLVHLGRPVTPEEVVQGSHHLPPAAVVTTASAVEQLTQQLSGWNVLLVDDDTVVRAALKVPRLSPTPCTTGVRRAVLGI